MQIQSSKLIFEYISCNLCSSNSQEKINIGYKSDPIAKSMKVNDSQWVICKKCSLVYQSPRPSFDIWKKLYEKSFYREVAGGVDNEGTHTYSYIQLKKVEPWLNSLGIFIGKDFPKSYLDFGCGIGGTLKYLLDHGCSEVHGIEVDPTCRQEGQKFFQVSIASSFKDESIKNKKFDFIYTHHALEHLHDINDFFSSAHQIMDDNGTLMIVIPSYWSGNTMSSYATSISHNFILTHHTLKIYLEKYGFKYISHKYSHIPGSDHELWCVAKKTLNSIQSNLTETQFSKQIFSDSIKEIKIWIPLRSTIHFIPENFLAHIWQPSRNAIAKSLKNRLSKKAFLTLKRVLGKI